MVNPGAMSYYCWGFDKITGRIHFIARISYVAFIDLDHRTHDTRERT